MANNARVNLPPFHMICGLLSLILAFYGAAGRQSGTDQVDFVLI